MIKQLFQYLTRKIDGITFKDNSYYDEEYFKNSIENNFAGWYSESDLTKRIEFIVSRCYVNNNIHVLDVACGHGRYSELLSKMGNKVTGTDISSTLISYLRKRYENIEFLRRDITENIFPNKYELIVVIGNSLSLLPKGKCIVALAAFEKSLKKNGKIFIELDNREKFLRQEAGKKNWNFYQNKWLVLSEHIYDEKNSLEKTRDIGINVDNQTIDEFCVTKQLYTKNEIVNMLKSSNFNIREIYGDWNGMEFNRDSECLIIIGEK